MSLSGLELATWAAELEPSPSDLALAERSLRDTLAVTLAARAHPLRALTDELDEVTGWAALGHVLDFDDLHLPSTAHVSVVCTMATLAVGGDARCYLAGAGVMARLGTALGWSHYSAGWHATCTAGAPAAAVAAGLALGLTPDGLARAMALALPAAGGVQRTFGTDGKSLQVGFAAAGGVRAARLVAAGATAEPGALEEWLRLVGGDPKRLDLEGEAVPGGLAVKLFPCCYAMQRPIVAVRELSLDGIAPSGVVAVRVETPESALQPLIHHRPTRELEAKFSLEYAVAATLLDGYPGLSSFTDAAVQRRVAQDLISRVKVTATPGGDSLLSGEVEVELVCADGCTLRGVLADPPGSPSRPPDEEALDAKLSSCGADVPALLSGISWSSAPDLLRQELPLGAGALARALGPG